MQSRCGSPRPRTHGLPRCATYDYHKPESYPTTESIVVSTAHRPRDPRKAGLYRQQDPQQARLTDAPTAAPAFQRLSVKPPNPDEDVDSAHKVPGGKGRFSRFGDTISKWNPILPAHSVVEPAVRCGARPTSSAQRRHMLQILLALLCAPFVAGLVLGGDQRVGAAAPLGR